MTGRPGASHQAAPLTGAFGRGATIANRLAVLNNAGTLAMAPTTPPLRRHLLSGGREGQYAVDLVHPHRLVFEPTHDPIPRTPDGGIDINRVTAITIMEVVDYH